MYSRFVYQFTHALFSVYENSCTTLYIFAWHFVRKYFVSFDFVFLILRIAPDGSFIPSRLYIRKYELATGKQKWSHREYRSVCSCVDCIKSCRCFKVTVCVSIKLQSILWKYWWSVCACGIGNIRWNVTPF